MNFGVFILSHKRPNRVKTLKALKAAGYTGDLRIIVDDLDETVDEYKKLYGDKVIVFDKLKKLKECDTMDNFNKVNIVLPARNSCHEIAKKIGWDYFLELDDDYSEFCIRYPQETKLAHCKLKNIDEIIKAMIDFLEVSGALCICFSQGGDYLGGINGRYIHKKLVRKAMNCFFCKTDRPFSFLGTINEDVNMYVQENMRGNLVFSSTLVSCVQEITQQNAGGLTDIYLDVGTYVKSFYSVIAEPSCVCVHGMGQADRRIHHQVKWINCAPMILNEKYKRR